MARMPGAVWKPLPGSSTTKMSAHDITCFHTMVGSLAGTDNYFRTQATGTNSHFGVGGDGTIFQWVDTAYRSGANLNGNYHIISAETADMGAPFGPWSASNVPAWTQAQVEACAAIAKWAHDTHGIPLTQIPDAKPGRRGVGYHRLGVPGYMVAGAEQWSTSKGKVCPGDHRIGQIPAVIAAAQGISPTPEPLTTVPEDDMPVVLRDPDHTIWLYTGLEMARISDQNLSGAQQKINAGRIIDITWPEVDALSADVDRRRGLLNSAVWATPLGADGAVTGGAPWASARLAGIDAKTSVLSDPKGLADALAQELPSSGSVSQAEIEAALKKVLGSLDNAV